MAQGRSGGCYSVEQRIEVFWKKVTVLGPNDCWIFEPARKKWKHGAVWCEGKYVGAHIFSYELRNGKMSEGKQGCHTCDNPPCVNPDHIFPGTQSDNIQDMLKKKRNNPRRGVNHPKATLTEDQVREIRSDPRGAVKLSRIYGVSIAAISAVKNRHHWKHVK